MPHATPSLLAAEPPHYLVGIDIGSRVAAQ